jgi:hypothetical protein
MIRSLKWFFSILILVFIAGCGSNGSVSTGNTVYIQASIKPSTTGVVFANMSGSTIKTPANLMNFTIKSTPYSTTGTIPNSDVNIQSVSFKYTPIPPAPAFTPTFTSVPYAGLLTPGGTLDISNVPILYDNDLTHISAAAISLGLVGQTLQYIVDVTFHGEEVNTGANLSNTINISASVDQH